MAAVAINILFGLVKLIDLLGIEFNYFYSPKVIDIVIFSSSVDLWIWAVSLLFIMLTILWKRIFHKFSFPRWTIPIYGFWLASLAVFLVDYRIALLLAIPLGLLVVSLSVFFVDGFLAAKRLEASSLVLMGIVGMLIPLELASVSSWVFNAFNYEVPFGSDVRWRFPLFDLQLFNVLYPFIPLLFMILLYGWIWIPALRFGLSRIGRRNDSSIQPTARLGNRSLAFGLILSSAVSVFVTCYPYVHLPSSALVGVDSQQYYAWLEGMMQKGPGSAFGTDRPIFNLLMYFVKYVTALSPEAVVRIMPAIIAVGLGLAVFWFVREGTNDERLALLSSLFSAFSFQTTVGMFAYSLANWFAIIETFLLLVFLLKGSKNHSWRCMLMSGLLGIAVLLTHPYTWDVLMIVLIMYLAWTFLRRSEGKWQIAPLAVLLLANLLFYVFYGLAPFGKGVGQGNGGVLNAARANIGFPSLLRLQNGLGLMVSNWVGGLFGNPLMIILAIAGMFAIIEFTRSLTNFNRIVLLWVIIPSLALFAMSPAQEVLYYRLVYIIPIQILAAIGLRTIFNRIEDAERKLKLNPTHSYILRILLFTLVVLLLLNYSLRSVDEAMITTT
jgi:hypothetical protein